MDRLFSWCREDTRTDIDGIKLINTVEELKEANRNYEIQSTQHKQIIQKKEDEIQNLLKICNHGSEIISSIKPIQVVNKPVQRKQASQQSQNNKVKINLINNNRSESDVNPNNKFLEDLEQLESYISQRNEKINELKDKLKSAKNELKIKDKATENYVDTSKNIKNDRYSKNSSISQIIAEYEKFFLINSCN